MLRESATTIRSAGTSAAALLLLPVLAVAEGPRIAIIIDDLGYHAATSRRTVQLPGPVACAILPGGPRAAAVAEAAHAAGKEVLLHLPLEPMERSAPPEPGEIGLDTTRREFSHAFARSIAAVPHVSGVNTHRGSLLTQHPGHMSWLMEEIAAHPDLFFVDSYTTHRSIALQFAREGGVPAIRRDVFLDPDRSPATVEREFARLKKLARVRGMAVGIGHPYPATLALLERELPKLRDEGFTLVGVRDYIALGNLAVEPQASPRRSPAASSAARPR